MLLSYTVLAVAPVGNPATTVNIHGNKEKELGIVVAILANSDDEAGHCGSIGQGKKLSARDPDIYQGSILVEHKK